MVTNYPQRKLPRATFPQDNQDAQSINSPEKLTDTTTVMTEMELAQRWKVSVKTLQRWRSEGRGPRYMKISKQVSYPLSEVLQFEHNALHDSTSAKTHPKRPGGMR